MDSDLLESSRAADGGLISERDDLLRTIAAGFRGKAPSAAGALWAFLRGVRLRVRGVA